MNRLWPSGVMIDKVKSNNSWFLLAEFMYFFYLWYQLFGVSLGLSIPNLGALWLFFLAVLCFPIFDWQGYAKWLIFFEIAIAGMHVLIQVFFYGVSINNGYVINYVWWPFTTLIIATLMQRPAFIKRLVMNMTVIALIWAPFLVYQDEGGIQRATLQAGNILSNSNAFAYWLGFCILFLWLWSNREPRRTTKLTLRTIALVAFLIAVLTISRGFILTLGIAFIVSLRSISISRRTVTIIVLIFVSMVALSFSPQLRTVLEYYNLRFIETSARFDVLQLGIEGIARNPIMGYGVNKMRALLPITPHNEVILLWFTSGMFPAITYLVFVAILFKTSLSAEKLPVFVSPLPLVVYAIVAIPSTNIVLPSLWATTILCFVFSIDGWRRYNRRVHNPQQNSQENRHIPVST